MTLTRNGGLYPYYAFAFMTLEQMYECSYDGGITYATCQAETDICPVLASGGSVNYRVDTSNEYYMNNWYV